jgi:hypothetical protein
MNNVYSFNTKSKVVVSNKASDLPEIGEAWLVKFEEGQEPMVLAVFRDGFLVTRLGQAPRLSKEDAERDTAICA